jgi:hypothetical protein
MFPRESGLEDKPVQGCGIILSEGNSDPDSQIDQSQKRGGSPVNAQKRYALMLILALFAGTGLVAMAWATGGNTPLALGGAPTVVAYQGEVHMSGTPYTGDGYFKFAIVNAAGNTSYWSNDGSSVGGGEPTTAVQLAVSEGLFSVLLGDTTLGGMTQALEADVFDQPKRYLRVWFSSDSSTFSQLTPDTRVTAVPYALKAQEAVDADTVDGLHASELGTDYQNMVIVAKSGGDHTSVQTAIDSITDAAAGNAYLVWVAPGAYVEQVTMKPYVHLQGAGQEVTIISSNISSGAWPPDQATLLLASDTSLRDLTVSNDGTGTRGVAVLATAGTTGTLVTDVTARAQGGNQKNYAFFLTGSGTGATLRQGTALAEGGSIANYGLVNYGGRVTLRSGSFVARGGQDARGIGIAGSGTLLEAVDVTALGEDGTDYNRGLFNENDAVAKLQGGSFTGRGGANAFGIHNSDTIGGDAKLEGKHITALGEDGSSLTDGLRQDGGTVHLALSQLDGDATRTGGTIVCYGVYRGNFSGYTCP